MDEINAGALHQLKLSLSKLWGSHILQTSERLDTHASCKVLLWQVNIMKSNMTHAVNNHDMFQAWMISTCTCCLCTTVTKLAYISLPWKSFFTHKTYLRKCYIILPYTYRIWLMISYETILWVCMHEYDIMFTVLRLCICTLCLWCTCTAIVCGISELRFNNLSWQWELKRTDWDYYIIMYTATAWVVDS